MPGRPPAGTEVRELEGKAEMELPSTSEVGRGKGKGKKKGKVTIFSIG